MISRGDEDVHHGMYIIAVENGGDNEQMNRDRLLVQIMDLHSLGVT